MLTSLLSDNFMKPPDNPSKGIGNPFDFSMTKSEKDVLLIN
jgi:hypothetical protein